MGTKEKVEDKAQEKITLSRAEVWMLRIAAATGVVSMLSHGGQLISQIF